MLYCQMQGQSLTAKQIQEGLYQTLERLSPKKVLAIPPDITRIHSKAGELTNLAWKYLGKKLTDILPALGTHAPMSEAQISTMFGDTPAELFRVHNWRQDLVTLGTVPGHYIETVSQGKVDFDWPAQVNKLLTDPKFDLILSIGQVVPHEVVGMANHAKNIFVGTGGSEGINKSHFLGAVFGMEKIMGRADTPVRQVLNYAAENFARDLPIVYVLTVVAPGADGLEVRGLFIGDDSECFYKAAQLSLEVNFQMLSKPLDKVVVYLDPEEYHSTWLGNKSIYRTRMAMADRGQLIILAPAVKQFGEDAQIDRLIRKFGYVGADEVLSLTRDNPELQNNLSAAAHLIHGSSEGRFSITYCPGRLSESDIRAVNFNYGDLQSMQRKYDPQKLKAGMNIVDGEDVFFVPNPGLGLWACEDNFN